MRTMIRTTAAICSAVILLGAVSGPAVAGHGGNREENKFDLAKVANAKLTLTQAIDAARVAVGGNAVDANFADEGGRGVWEIELAQNSGAVRSVFVDMVTGAVETNAAMEGENEEEQSGDVDAENIRNHHVSERFD